MDTLSTSVSTFKLPTFNHPTTTRDHHLVKPHHQPPPSPHCHLTTSLSIKSTTTNFTQTSFPTPLLSSSHQSLKLPTNHFHQKAASGYAAALFATAQQNNAIVSIEKEVKRLSKILRNTILQDFMNDKFVAENDKGKVLKEVVGNGRFNSSLVKLVNLLIDNGKIGMIGEVLGEFERIYDEINGIKVVLVSSSKKMAEEELVRIAKKVQKVSGAEKVKVKNVVDEGLAMAPAFSFAA